MPPKRKGRRPRATNGELLEVGESERAEGYPLLSFRHLQSRFGVDEMRDDAQRSDFLTKWVKRACFSWKELSLHPRHGLGWEMIPADQVRPRVPEQLGRDKYMVFRHEENHAFVGFRAGDVFHVLWIEAKYGDLYDH